MRHGFWVPTVASVFVSFAALGACSGDSTDGDGGSDEQAGAAGALGGRNATGGRSGSGTGGRAATGGRSDAATGGMATGGDRAAGGRTSSGGASPAGGSDTGAAGDGGAAEPGEPPLENPLTNPESGPPAGNPDGDCEVPAGAGPADASNPDQVVGSGTAASCTADAFIEAVAQGGVITFDCGPDPTTIVLDRPAKVFNDASDEIVIDGGGKVTLSGGGKSRILYMNTCDEAQHWTTSHCQDQETPRLTVQNLTFIDASSKSESEYDGGGAIWVRGGQFRLVNTRFFNNVCADEGPDLGGAAVRVFSQYQGRPVHVVNSTFGGAEGYGNVCSNGGGLSSIGVSWNVINSLFTHNRAVGEGGNPAESGTPGGGSGGAIYADGGTMSLRVCGSRIENNQVNAYGSAIFFVSNSHTGTLEIESSVIRNNRGGGWNVLPGISMHEDTTQLVRSSTIE